MTAAVTRDLEVVYAGLSLGGSTDYHIDGAFTFELTDLAGELSFEVLLSKDTEAAFITAEALLVTAFRTPRARLLVELGATEKYDFDPSDYTGSDHVPSIVKPGSPEDSSLMARYRCSVTFNQPGNLYSQNGRVESRVALVTSPSGRRSFTVSGVYTALTGVGTARTTYEHATNGIASYITTLTTAFGGTWTKVAEEANANETNTRLDFQRQYNEIIYTEGLSGLDDADLIDPSLTISIETAWPGDTPDAGVVKPATARVFYKTAVDKDRVTNLKQKWDNSILPFLINRVQTIAGGAVALVSGQPVFDLSDNQLEASLEFQTFYSGLLEHMVDTDDDIDNGLILTPVWDDNPFRKDVDQGVANHIRTITTTTLRKGVAGVGTGGGVLGSTFGSFGSPKVSFAGGGLLGIGAQQVGALLGNSFVAAGNLSAGPENEFVELTNLRRNRRFVVGSPLASVQLVLEVSTQVFARVDKR